MIESFNRHSWNSRIYILIQNTPYNQELKADLPALSLTVSTIAIASTLVKNSRGNFKGAILFLYCTACTVICSAVILRYSHEDENIFASCNSCSCLCFGILCPTDRFASDTNYTTLILSQYVYILLLWQSSLDMLNHGSMCHRKKELF